MSVISEQGIHFSLNCSLSLSKEDWIKLSIAELLLLTVPDANDMVRIRSFQVQSQRGSILKVDCVTSHGPIVDKLQSYPPIVTPSVPPKPVTIGECDYIRGSRACKTI
jgi:hypothetical protein